jgi:predicted metal-binding protein
MTNTENPVLDAVSNAVGTPKHTLFVCALCRSSVPNGITEGQDLINHLNHALAEQGIAEQIHLQPVRCMGACSQSCVAALAAPNKLTFIFNQLSVAQTADLVQLSRQYLVQANGNVPYKERPLAIRSKLMVVLPALPSIP